MIQTQQNDETSHQNKVQTFEKRINQELQKAQKDLEIFTKNDQSFRRRDTVEVVKNILDRVKAAATEINQEPEEVREKLYYLTFNATVIIFKACHQIRISNFSRQATNYLAFNILCLDNNLILTTAKYIDWRVTNYVELARSYSDFGALKAATKVISYGLGKIIHTKQVEEQDPPVPDGTKDSLIDALRVLKTQELKYELQSGTINPDTWKKKLEETFQGNKYHRSLAIVECLQINEQFQSGEKQKGSKLSQLKKDSLKLVIDFIKPDVELVKQALIQIHEKKRRDREKKEKLLNRDPEIEVEDILDKYKNMDAEMIKENDWKFASISVPIEIHVELVKLTYECQLWNEFASLLDPALVRLKFRRYEVPYLATVDVMMSASKNSNIPNGFEKLAKDLNSANLRIELKKLRATAKKSAGNVSKTDEPKKEETKKNAPPAKDQKDAKGKKPDAKGAQQQQAEEEQKQQNQGEIQVSESELEAIKHVYVHMLLQRTKNPQNAIVGIDIVMADENLGPDLADNHYAVAVPIRQHAGSYEKQNLIPYIVFRRTANSLIDEEDSLSIITDVCVIQGQDHNLRAPLGYTRINIDLRQTPKDLERVPNLDYVYVCYKTDRQLALAERDLLILRRLAELEKSFVQRKTEEFKQLGEIKTFLSITFNQDLLVDLSNTVKEALLGPLGQYYIEQRKDMLNEISSLLWRKYMLPVLQKIDIYVEMKGQREYFNQFNEKIDEAVIKVRKDFVETLNVIYRILTGQDLLQDIVMYCKCCIYLASLQEETGQFRNSIQVLRGALGKVIEFREERLRKSLDSESNQNASTAMSITIDNKKISELEIKMETIYQSWEEMILRKERERKRKESEQNALDDNEGDEEQYEVRKCKEELRNKDLFEKGIDIALWQKENKIRTSYENKKFYGEVDLAAHSLHLDILMNLYRCEIKQGKESKAIKQQTNELLKSSGIDLSKDAPGNLTKNLAAQLNQKMNLAKGKTMAATKSALKNLQQTLQEAGKLPTSKPQILSYEKILEKENNQNPYQNSLLYMALALAKSNNVEQKSLLLESLEFLKKAEQSEQQLSDLTLDNAVYVKAAQKFHDYFKNSPDKILPFNLLSSSLYIKKTTVPQKPILICRSSTSVTMKLPFYKPITEYKAWRNIQSVALYGKPSGSGVAVSLNNTEYDGLGEQKSPGHIVNVTGLIPNEKYVFAAGGYTPEGKCVNGIGETSNEILTLLPLSLHQLFGYLAEISFKLGHYQISKQASEALCYKFIIKNQALLDSDINHILSYKLDQDYIQRISTIEVKQLAESFVILAQVSKIVRNEVQRRADNAELQIEKQKIDMKIANYLILALELSITINRPQLTKKVVAEIFNHLNPYFMMKPQPQILLYILLKCQQSVRVIPQYFIDANIRRIIGCISYQVARICLESSEELLAKRAMISEIPIVSRKWRRYAQYIISTPQLSNEDKEKQDDQLKRIEQGEKIPQQELIKDPEPYEECIYQIEEFEDEGNSFEEFLLSMIEFQDIVKVKTEKWKEQISLLLDQVTGGEQIINNIKEKVGAKMDFWEQLKSTKPSALLQALFQQRDSGQSNVRNFEFCCKCIRRALEIGDYNSFEELGDKVRDGLKISEEDEQAIENFIKEKIEFLEQDIVKKQRQRFSILEEKVKQILEQQALQGGSATLGQKKLQKLVDGDIDKQEIENNDQIVSSGNLQNEMQKFYSYLWISEKFLLQGICVFLGIVNKTTLMNQFTLQIQGCVFNNILQIDFLKYKNVLEQYKKEIIDQKAESEGEQKVEISDRVRKMNDLVKIMARAAIYARMSKSWLQLISIIRYTWNVLTYDLINPLELTLDDGWLYITMIAECSLTLIEHLQSGGSLRQTLGRNIDQIKNQKPSLDKDLKTRTVNFNEENKTQNEINTINTEENNETKNQVSSKQRQKWFTNIDEFDINQQASLIIFTVQSLMAVSKWESLVSISNRLNIATENEFAYQLLPFIIFAQSTLHKEAEKNTQQKREALELRIQQFENWKLTSKKKRSRQAMLTGEIPIEEQEFNRDKSNLEKEIFRLDVIENVLLADKKKSEFSFQNLEKEQNRSVEFLNNCRKLYTQYGIDLQNLQNEKEKLGKSHPDIKSKRKNLKTQFDQIINSYNKCVWLLRKNQEKTLLIYALHEQGNIYYSDDNLKEADICWNDCIDTIFQKLYVVNEFREVFKENKQLADAFGSKQVLVGGIVLIKLAKLCYEGSNLHRYRECVLMATELFYAPAKLSLPHPLSPIEFQNYAFREFIGNDLFEDPYILQPSELINNLSFCCQALIDEGLIEKVLPLASLMEYVACDIVRSKILTLKARILRTNAMIELGLINSAVINFKKILSLKSLPDYGSRMSEYQEKQKGKNLTIQNDYQNHLSPDNEQNQACIKYLQDPIPDDVEQKLQQILSPYLFEYIHFLKSLLLVRLGEIENVESPEKSEFRNLILKTAEDQLRNSLKRVQLAEEIFYIKNEISINSKKQEEYDEQKLKALKEQLQQTFERALIQKDKQDKYYSNSEEEMCVSDQKSQRLGLILRARELIGRIYESQGQILESFYIRRQGLINLKSLAEGQYREVEKGTEPESKGSFKLPDSTAAAGAPAAGAKKPPAPAAKDPKGKEKPTDDQELKKQEEERIRQAKEEAEKLKILSDALEKRCHLNINLWLKIKIQIIRILLGQRKYEDCIDAIETTRNESNNVNDKLYSRMLLEIEFQIKIQSGDINKAIKIADQIREIAKHNYHNDHWYCDFLGNYSELLYNMNKSHAAIEIINEAVAISQARLQSYGIIIDSNNINNFNDGKVWEDRLQKYEEDLESQMVIIGGQTAAAASAAKGGKDAGKAAPKGGTAAKAGQPVEEAEEPQEQLPLDFSKPIEYNLQSLVVQPNTSTKPSNLYLLGLEQLIRLKLRQAQYLTLLKKQNLQAKYILEDIGKLISRTLYLSPQIKFYEAFLLGYVNQMIFYDKISEFQEQFTKNYKYKEKFTKHVPYQSIALSQFMIELPNMSEKLKKEFLSYLEWSEKSYQRSIEIAKQEAVVYEFDFSITDSLRGLSDVCFLIAEYRERILYKYAGYSELDYERKLNRLLEKKKAEAEGQTENFDMKALKKEISESVDKWEEMKNDKEVLAVFNYKNKANKYLEAAIASAISQSEFLDKQHELSTVNLTDAQKIPKEVISELYESSQINKIITQKLPDFEFKDKTQITSGEVLAYFKSVVYECCMLTFGNEKSRLSKLISKIHRYLISNLSSYTQKCVFNISDFPDSQDASEAAKKLICPVSQINCQFFDFQGRKSQLFYILGPLDENIIKKEENEQDQTEQQKRELSDAKIENQIIYFGKVELDALTISTLYQETKDLIEQMKVSEKQSEDKNRRDRKYQRQMYHNLIERFGNIFKAPVVSEEELERDVDTLALVKDFIPELNIDNVSRLAQILQKHQGCSLVNPNLNAILRKFHRIRYIK